MKAQTMKEREMHSLIVPVSQEHYVIVNANWPLTPDEWELFQNILSAMKPGIVDDDADNTNCP